MSDEEQKKIFSENLRYYLDKYGTPQALKYRLFRAFLLVFC